MESARPPTDPVLRKVKALYRAPAAEEALRLLEAYDGPEADRVRLAALRLAGGDLAALRSRLEVARADYRDLLAWAEFPRQMRLPAAELKARTEDERKELARADREEYEAWLRGE